MGGFTLTGRKGTRAGWVALGLCLALVCGTPCRADSETVLIEAGTLTSYLANTEDPQIGLDWTDPLFVEGPEWQTGPFGIGFDTAIEPPDADGLIATPVSDQARSIYTRTTFAVANAEAVESLFLGLDYDDGVVVWINDEEVYRTPEMRNLPLLWNIAPLGQHESSNGAAPDYTPLRDLSDRAIPFLVDGDNVLAMGIYNNGQEDLVLAPRLSIDKMLTRAPYLQEVTPTSIRVLWRTAVATNSQVDYGTEHGALDVTVPDGTLVTEHEVLLDGLSPSTRYYYAVGSSTETLAGGDSDHFFDTPPAEGTAQPTRIWVLGDTGQGNIGAALVRDAYYGFTASRHTDLWLMLGDNAYVTGTEEEYQQNLFDIYPEMLRKSVLWPTIGNHDLSQGPGAWPYFSNFVLPTTNEVGGANSGTENYYSFDYANIHFIVLDSMFSVRSPTGDMMTWLVSDLQETTADWIIAYWHHPPISKGSHDSDNFPTEIQLVQMRENALPVLDDYGVDLVLSGHSHSYERSYLIDGHYGYSGSFLQSMKKDPGDGSLTGDGAYQKPLRGAVPYTGEGDGIVYTVAGSGSHISTGNCDDLGGTGPCHPAMLVSLWLRGSVVLDIDGNRLDAIFLDENGDTLDNYTIFKGGTSQAPVADFDASPRNGTIPLSVSFSDLSLNFPSGWSWDFEDDGTPDSVASNPSHEYTVKGAYSVSLTVSNSEGTDATSKQAFICATEGPLGEITGLSVAADTATIAWTPSPGATAYDLVKGDLSLVKAAGGFEGSQLGCLTSVGVPQVVDPGVPAPGQAFYYMVRGVSCVPETGSYDTSSPFQFRSRDLAVQGPDGTCSCPDGDDTDLDGYCTAYDNCPDVASADLSDNDEDGIGNVCDDCPEDSLNDGDNDGFCADEDNCPIDTNPDQTNTDGDEQGDECDPDDDDDGIPDGADTDPLDPLACQDLDDDNCDDCSSGTNDPLTDGVDTDDDGLCDLGDPCTDADGDGLGTGTLGNVGCPDPATDSDDGNEFVCADTDGDLCDDCSGSTWDPVNDGEDSDSDSICNLGDNCLLAFNPDQADFDLDTEGDACDLCTDQDGDEYGNPGFPVNTCPDDNCPSMFNDDQANADGDDDGDVCDICRFDPLNDADQDFHCADEDNCPTEHNAGQENADGDADGDACDECTDTDDDGYGNPGFAFNTCDEDNCPNTPNAGQENFDGDTQGDICDPDDDNDGVIDTEDDAPFDQFHCRDADGDQCEDCVSGVDNPAQDGQDTDTDGICDLGDNCDFTYNPGQLDGDDDGSGDLCDSCTDADGDGLGTGTLGNSGCLDTTTDSNDASSGVCADTDGDSCDDCAVTSWDPANDGDDADVDGVCDLSDACTDADGDGLGNGNLANADCVNTTTDSNDASPGVCADTDGDGCDDCAVTSWDPANDGDDADVDGVCDLSDACTDADGDGLGNGNLANTDCVITLTDSNDASPGVCADTDGDSCDDCAVTTWDPANDGDDGDTDGLCDLGDDCTDADGDGLGTGTLGNTGCINTTTDSDDGNPSECADTDGDNCDDCAITTWSPSLDGADGDTDGICDLGDDCTDADEDGLGTGTLGNSGCINPTTDSNDDNSTACADVDGDNCDDCAVTGAWNPDNDGTDSDVDGLCNLGDGCTDADGDGLGSGTLGNTDCINTTTDSNDTSPGVCADTDDDNCDDCSVTAAWNPDNDGTDTDVDGLCDLGDACTDADGDGLGNGNLANTDCVNTTTDSNDTSPGVCADTDDDNCDDCSVTAAWNPANDGTDGDTDGICDLGDACTDADGDGLGSGTLGNTDCINTTTDSNDASPGVCADTDSDNCDDCSVTAAWNPANDGTDGDTDGICDLGDSCTDADGDGLGSGTLGNTDCVNTTTDSNDTSAAVCADTDGDNCDDCSVTAAWNPANDGPDADTDGICDLGDSCTDADGDGLGSGTLGNVGCVNPTTDSNDTSPGVCADTDGDNCDDCSVGPWDPANDGTDTDVDGLCDLGDACTDADGDGLGNGNLANTDCVIPLTDSNDNDSQSCADTDGDSCNDCAITAWDPANDGPDADTDGACDPGDVCPADRFNDADGDGLCADDDNCPSVANVTQMDGDLDNIGDLCGFVSVEATHFISATEVTNQEYVEFLNAVAAADPNQLFNEEMEDRVRGGIRRFGSDGSYSYEPKNDMGNKPVNFVSWLDAARYVNWLENGRPVGSQGSTTTESGAYDLAIGDPGRNAVRSSGASWFLPTEDEWNEAAYVDSDSGVTWDYPTRSHVEPALAAATSNGDIVNRGFNVVNYGREADWNLQDGNVTTVGGVGPLATSYTGTYDQGGNVAEWVETLAPNEERVVRGGSYRDGQSRIRRNSSYDQDYDEEKDSIGFRVAAATTCADPDTDGYGTPASPACPQGLEPDNCPAIANADQIDNDGDGNGDVCDSCTDVDGDGLGNGSMGNSGCPIPETDSDDGDAGACADTDGDGCDDCALSHWDPVNDGVDTDGDGACDVGDDDDDDDGVDDESDLDPTNPFVCRDLDGDNCDDCTSGTDDPANDGTDTDTDGQCNVGDPDDDNDGVIDGLDSEPLDRFLCRDADDDGCDDCTSGTNDPTGDGTDTDLDGQCDDGDPDDDNDTVADGDDWEPLNPFACRDEDGDSCDDCSSGSDDPASDGTDSDFDGQCNASDPDDDNDGVIDGLDNEPLNPFACRDADGDTCDDCTSGTNNPSGDGLDTDLDGQCNAGDPDDDNDGVEDDEDWEPLNPFACRDDDGDSCDDCSGGSDSPGDDGTDTDEDGQCNASDPDDDNDGVIDGLDSDPLDRFVCRDADGDGCEDCSSGISAPTNDGPDTDSDGLCDDGDPDDDNDGVEDGSDSDPLYRFLCRDADGDNCDDCNSGTDAPNDDGADGDADGICDLGDSCTDGDGDGLGTGTLGNAGCVNPTTDSDDTDPASCADVDGDNCDDCVLGAWNPAGDGPDADTDGLCDVGDSCTDVDGDGLGIGTLGNVGCVHPAVDSDDGDPLLCADTDGDGCDDCASATWDPAGDGADFDADGLCDLGDPDDDDDSVEDSQDCLQFNGSVAAIPDSVGATLSLAKSSGIEVTLAWQRTSQGHTYNVYGFDASYPGTLTGDFTCLSAEEPEATASHAVPPTPGTITFFLIGARNACGDSPSPTPPLACPTLGNDTDGDDVPDLEDNCAGVWNPGQEDADNDFVGDACDD